MTITVSPHATAWSQVVAHQVTSILSKSIKQKGQVIVAISGHRCIFPILQVLASDSINPPKWNRVHLVIYHQPPLAQFPPHHSHTIHPQFTSLLNIPPQQVHQLPLTTNVQNSHSRIIRRIFNNAPIVFDLFMLEIGTDGSVAGIPPANPVKGSSIPPLESISSLTPRSTSATHTYQYINSSKAIMLLAQGAVYAPRLKHIFAHRIDPSQYPVHGVTTSSATHWFLDRSAASQSIPTPNSHPIPSLKLFHQQYPLSHLTSTDST